MGGKLESKSSARICAPSPAPPILLALVININLIQLAHFGFAKVHFFFLVFAYKLGNIIDSFFYKESSFSKAMLIKRFR